MKHGKGSHKRRAPEAHPLTVGFQPSSVSSEQKHDSDLQRSFSDLLENIGSTASVSSIQPWLSNNDVVMQSTTLQSAPPAPVSSAFDDSFWTNAMANGHNAASRGELMSPTSHGPSNAYLKTLDDTLSLPPNTNFPQFISAEACNSNSSSSSSASPVPTDRQNPLLRSQQCKDNSGTHDCYSIANSTLAILHVSSRPVTNDCGSDSNFSVRTPTHAVQHLDELLRCTRDAMGNMLHLLKCSCASDPQTAMLDAFIIIRILYWHQLAAGIKILIPCRCRHGMARHLWSLWRQVDPQQVDRIEALALHQRPSLRRSP